MGDDMAQVILLGTGAALCDATREQTYLVARGARSAILIDCGGSPAQRLSKAGIALESIDHVILTHHHPDHIYGLSVFLLALWLAGRQKVLRLYGLAETLRAARGMMRAFEWERWLKFGFFPVEFHRIAKDGHHAVISTPDFSVHTTTVQHLLPTLAVRVESRVSGKVIVYSSDTEMCDAVPEFARGADILFHEATTLVQPTRGHSTARQAGAQAQRAGVKKLVLVHLPPRGDPKRFHAAAKQGFSRQVVVGKDFAAFEF